MDGTFRSKLEEDYAYQLTLNLLVWEYEPWSLEYYHRVSSGTCNDCGGSDVYQIRSYTPDFVIGNHVLEVKGKFTPALRGKMINVKRAWPDYTYWMLFDLNNRLVPMRKTGLSAEDAPRYSDWCEKNGFRCVLKELTPEDIEVLKSG